jgi:protein-disulfide isomerase
MSGAALTPPVGERDHAAGPDDAPVTLVEYGDYECPYCGMAHPIVQKLQAALGKQLRFVFRNFPLNEAHPHARMAAQAAEAAGAQGKFWEMHDMLFEHQDALDRDDILGYAKSIGVDAARLAHELDSEIYEKHVREDFRSGVKSGVNGTPSFFINGERYDGSWANQEAFLGTLREVASRGSRATSGA